NDTAARELEHLPQLTETAFGEAPGELEIEEGGLSFRVPLTAGQKTGWFYDQAANPARPAPFVSSRGPVLHAWADASGWAPAALPEGAASAHCLDASQPALEVARANAERNGRRLETLHADAFDGLKALAASGERFDIVILDPPAFIKRKKDIPQGQAAYRQLNH